MDTRLQKGKLVRWNDNRGFGFIASGDGEKDIFIHVSALKRMVRRPAVGDIIFYQLHTDADGKRKAVNAKIEGVAEVKPRPVQQHTRKQYKNSWFARILPVVFVILLGAIAYNKLVVHKELRGNSITPVSSSVLREEDSRNYTCAGKVYCSEMTSCDEAKFYQRNCPGTKMDGDGDGIPCENQWCGY